jgi:hypothetical protein
VAGAVDEGPSDGLLDLPASEATGADADTPGGSVDHGPNPLKVGIERALCLIVGVTHVMA